MLLPAKNVRRLPMKRLRAVVVDGWEQKATTNDQGYEPLGSGREEKVATTTERAVARKASCHNFAEEESTDGCGFAERGCREDKKGKSRQPVDLKGRIENGGEELPFDNNRKECGGWGTYSRQAALIL
ncbi:hypothetical protein B296_00026978 [Ensete ventricosum]|uniref:Uncharacterized protein n=1 Tax=Ensete ventricosum TaxID=4639 RepID=A0A426YNP5_ENSVE|nr:hypothetical protein B296_00026978 [Ensete ventricosum]